MKTVGERIQQARLKLEWSALTLAKKVGYQTQSGIANLENRAGGSGGNKIGLIAKALGVPLEWLMNGPDSDTVPFLKYPTDVANALPAEQLQLNPYAVGATRVYDDWTLVAIAIMQDLDPGQRQAMVAKMREFRQFLGPPRNGQALSMAG